MPRVLSALMFFPRGGSATVTRALMRRLPGHGWEPTILSGSIPGHGDAEQFYAGLDVHAACFVPEGDVPMHPSYEDRPGARDHVFAVVDDDEYERHVEAWAAQLELAGAPEMDVLHLHHLTPLHEAAARVAPDVPVVTHLHGTELLMLEEIAEGPPDSWTHAEAWAERMCRWAAGSDRVLLLSESQVDRATRLLGLEAERLVVLPNGFDPEAFDRHDIDRAAHWRRALADEPRGWGPGTDEGAIGYDREQATTVADGTVVVYVGRFTAVKRVGLLIQAWATARERFEAPASLVIVGGHPGEWEGDHPCETIAATGAEDVYLAGWHSHEELPDFLVASDVVVLPSVREQFGAVLVEGMGCGLPAIAVDRWGPAEIVEDGETGWLVEPDDEASLVAALVAAVNDPDERKRRGRAAYEAAHDRYAWTASAERLAGILDEARQSGRRLTPASA
jgi:glycosyltransferase involved in cell wall biosynthesis